MTSRKFYERRKNNKELFSFSAPQMLMTISMEDECSKQALVSLGIRDIIIRDIRRKSMSANLTFFPSWQ